VSSTRSFTRPLIPIGGLYALALDTFRMTFRRPFQWREFFDQAWFVTSVSLLPACLVSVSFGAVLALQVGSLFRELGAQSFTGAAAVLGIVQQAAPVATVIVIAGAGGSAVCADLGARTIREEIAATEVLGISPIQRYVVPRVLAMAVVSAMLDGIVTVVGIIGGYVFNVIVQHGTPGAYVNSFTAFAQLPDIYVGILKAFIFGLIAAIVAAYRGLNPGHGPKGVGDAVNQSVIITFVLLFLANAIISAIYFQIVPPKGM
jgi:phospholipid/cholesterol/gamma-HCH transport system permease protein